MEDVHSPKRPQLSWNTEGNGILRNINNKGNPIISFVTPITCPYYATVQAEYDYTEGKVKIGKLIIPFPLSPSLFISRPKVECW